MSLPKYAAFKSQVTGKYLQYIHEGPLKGKLQFSSDNVMSMLSKFELKPAGKKGDGYVNIRCCYNNKYWASSKDDDYSVTPFVSNPAENESSYPCTLYKLEESFDNDAYHIYDVWRKAHLVRRLEEDCLTTRYGEENEYYNLPPVLIDYETLVELPKNLVFKSVNKGYLCAHLYEDKKYLQFNSDDIGSSLAGHQVFNVGDGSIRIKCNHWNRFWVRQPNNWILANSTDTSANNKDTLFWPVKISRNVVALRNLGNNKFCARYTVVNKVSCLNANSDNITKEAQFEIAEPVISREIYNCRYRTMDGKVYEKRVVSLATGEASNGGTKEATMAVSLKYVVEKSKCWESGSSTSSGTSASITASIPDVLSVGFGVDYSKELTHTWGETINEMEEVMTMYTVIVPPNKKVKVTLLAMKSKCDIPFSYTQRDILMDGRKIITDCDDGLYTGVNTYQFDYQVIPLPL